MSKRENSSIDDESALKNRERPYTPSRSEMGGLSVEDEQFEDDFEDEFENEVIEVGTDALEEDTTLVDDSEEASDAKMDIVQDTFLPGRHKLSAGEILEPDESAYEMLHAMELPWPCLSFDIIRDNLGQGRARKGYPATVYAVSGTQAARGSEKENEILVMKMSNLNRLDRSDAEFSDDGEDEEDNFDNFAVVPILESKSIPLCSCTNRIRLHQSTMVDSLSTPPTTTATLLESGEIMLHDITPYILSFDNPGQVVDRNQTQPVHVIKSHGRTEGYAVDWAPLSNRRKLLTGDCNGRVFLTSEGEAASWSTNSVPFTGHTGSVEDLQWSPSERNVFASAGVDGTVKIWDSRAKAHHPALSIPISDTDVNVLSWSHLTSHLLASGADDGRWSVWDLRNWQSTLGNPSPVANFDFHKEQITSVEWHPTDDSVVAVAAGDNTLTLWDLAVELDDEESRDTGGVQDIPPQLLFVHYMEQIKECHWHPQIPGCLLATGQAGFGVLKTISI